MVAGQTTLSAIVSPTVIPESDTVPVFVTIPSNTITSPAPTADASPLNTLSIVIELTWGTVADSVSESFTGVPAPTADALAVLSTWPASRSAWVSVYDAVQVIDAPMARVVAGQLGVASAIESATPTSESATLPLLVTSNSYW